MAILQAVSLCVTPITRRGFGIRGLSAGPLSLLLMIVYAGAAKCGPLLVVYVPGWLAFCLGRRLTHDRQQHSRYPGWVWWAPFRRVPMRLLAEALLTLIAGCVLVEFGSKALGLFFVLASAAMYVLVLAESVARWRERIVLHDARAEFEALRRRMHGDDDGWS